MAAAVKQRERVLEKTLREAFHATRTGLCKGCADFAVAKNRIDLPGAL